jgi:hypothetical protein
MTVNLTAIRLAFGVLKCASGACKHEEKKTRSVAFLCSMTPTLLLKIYRYTTTDSMFIMSSYF